MWDRNKLLIGLMVDFLLYLFASIKDKSPLLKKIRFYSLERFLVMILANVMIPVWFRLTNVFKERRLIKSKVVEGQEIIVSLTTFPARIERIWIVIECILRQKHQPDRIILWLSKEQFKDISILPKSLLKLQSRGLEICLCQGDLRSHKKYYYAIKNFPNDTLITVDDDFIYPSTLIGSLIELNKKHPKAICCARAFLMKKEGESILPYNQWVYLNNGAGPSCDLFHTSGGGTLYPPGAFPEEVLNNEVFMKLCKHADDVWLNTMAQMNGTKIVKGNFNSEFIPLNYKRNITLSSVNVHEELNDKQLKEVREYYEASNSKDPLSNFVASK